MTKKASINVFQTISHVNVPLTWIFLLIHKIAVRAETYVHMTMGSRSVLTVNAPRALY